MTKHCPACQQVIPDGLPLSLQIRRALAKTGVPMAPRDIRALVPTTSTTLYQTLRRMAERGEIRKTTHPDYGTAWVLVPEVSDDAPAGLSARELQEGQEALESVLRDLVGYVQATGRVSRASAVGFLTKLGCDLPTAEDLINLATDDMLEVDAGDLVAP